MRDADRQHSFDLRLEWGLHGVKALTPESDAVVIVDVLSFSSAVDAALSRNATVYPYRWSDDTAAAYAESRDCLLAGRRGTDRWSLSPNSLLELPLGTRIVLPSPNGATLSIATGDVPTFAGCLRNAEAVAAAASALGRRVAVIPAGELVPTEPPGPRTMRFALEDLYGAGAILRHLEGTRSPEATAAVEAFEAAKGELDARVNATTSGRELIDRGFPTDVAFASDLESSDQAPRLRDGAYTA